MESSEGAPAEVRQSCQRLRLPGARAGSMFCPGSEPSLQVARAGVAPARVRPAEMVAACEATEDGSAPRRGSMGSR